ncbi:transmembrane protein EpsH [Sphingomonas taxi]|uniref:Transmembrane protein EpsH n=1 Tax=Sphingomonas taxi TaxID=1549858 RepID=A0A097EDP5_9SPHN|nr:exosortase A [Sphingomonas taxi]AIT05665.1 transmembrane protein EpsH [Sphingomonas taxi]
MTGAQWRRHAIGLALAAAAILLLVRDDVARLVSIWWTSTTFGHCLFIGPVIGWLVWQRRRELAALTPVAWWPGLALVAVGGAGWLMGDAGSVGFARQLGLVVMLQGAVVTLLGPQVARGLAFPLGYALFLVPFGEEMESLLQAVTVRMVMPLLHLAGVPASSNGVLIHAGRYWFEVAEACSGAKFVIAMLAFGVLVADVCFVSWRRRAWFLLAALVVPVLANGLRAFGTIYAAHLTSVEAATGFDHIVYGWLFFGLVMAAVLAIGWRWFDRTPDAPAFDPAALRPVAGGRMGLPIGVLLTLAVAGVWPMWSAGIAHRATPLPARIELPQVAGWTRAALSRRAPWMPYYPGADHMLFGRYARGGAAVDLAVAVFGSQGEGHKIGAFGTGAIREEDRWVRVADEAPIAGGKAMRITAAGPVERVVATWYVVGDTVTSDERVVKIETMKAKLFGGAQRAVAIHLSAEVLPGRDARADIAALAAALGPVDGLSDAVVAPR